MWPTLRATAATAVIAATVLLKVFTCSGTTSRKRRLLDRRTARVAHCNITLRHSGGIPFTQSDIPRRPPPRLSSGLGATFSRQPARHRRGRRTGGHRERSLHRQRRRRGNRLLLRAPRLPRGDAPRAHVRHAVARRPAPGAQRPGRRAGRRSGDAGRHGARARRLEPLLARGLRPRRPGRGAARRRRPFPQRHRRRASAAGRSCWTTRPATRSSCSNRRCRRPRSRPLPEDPLAPQGRSSGTNEPPPAPFRDAVVRAIRALQPGEVVSYGEVARRAGFPQRLAAWATCSAVIPATICPGGGSCTPTAVSPPRSSRGSSVCSRRRASMSSTVG